MKLLLAFINADRENLEKNVNVAETESVAKADKKALEDYNKGKKEREANSKMQVRTLNVVPWRLETLISHFFDF